MPLSRTVLVLGAASFFTDLSSEMIFPLLPLFLSTVLGAGTVVLGLIEGAAESVASAFKVVSGVWTDRTRRRLPLVIGGYTLSGAMRPLIGIAGSWWHVLGLRVLDRVGKGLRTSPRDALIADITADDGRGAAYGLHRAMDHAGAVVGPLVAAALLAIDGISLRQVFLLAAIPAAVALICLVAGVREPARKIEAKSGRAFELRSWKRLGKDFRRLLLALAVFTLGNSTDAFLLLRLADSGLGEAMVSALWSLHHVVKLAATYWGGKLSDSRGRKSLVYWGWVIYALVYVGFGAFDSPAPLAVIFLVYGIYFGLTEPSQRAWVADLVPPELRGTAFGWYHLAVSLSALPGGLLFGFLWQSFGIPVAFGAGAAFAGLAALILLSVGRRETTATGEAADSDRS